MSKPAPYETMTGELYESMTVPALRQAAKAYVASGRRLYRLTKHQLVVGLYEADIEYSEPEDVPAVRAALAHYLASREGSK